MDGCPMCGEGEVVLCSYCGLAGCTNCQQEVHEANGMHDLVEQRCVKAPPRRPVQHDGPPEPDIEF